MNYDKYFHELHFKEKIEHQSKELQQIERYAINKFRISIKRCQTMKNMDIPGILEKIKIARDMFDYLSYDKLLNENETIKKDLEQRLENL